jgi:hypothetical protein
MARLPNAIVIAVTIVLGLSISTSPSADAAAFHTSSNEITITVLPDGTGKTSHQVFDIAAWPITCAGVEAIGTVSAGVTFIAWKTQAVLYLPVAAGACSLGGSPIIAPPQMEGCNDSFRASGEIDIDCPPGKSIHYFTGLSCELTIPSQTNKTKVNYHNIEVSGVKAITAEINLSSIRYLSAGIGCGVAAGLHEDGKYTTGNVILSAEQPGSGMPVPFWIE